MTVEEVTVSYKSKDKATEFAHRVEKYCKLNHFELRDEDIEAQVRRIIPTMGNVQSFHQTTPEEVRKAIRITQLKKSSGLDKISNRALKRG